MTYHYSMGQFDFSGAIRTNLATPSAPADWRTPIVAAADRHFRAVAAARNKMPAWAQSAAGAQVLRDASDWVNASRTKTLDQLRLKNGFFPLISPTSMPATRYGGAVERDEVVASRAALKTSVPPVTGTQPGDQPSGGSYLTSLQLPGFKVPVMQTQEGPKGPPPEEPKVSVGPEEPKAPVGPEPVVTVGVPLPPPTPSVDFSDLPVAQWRKDIAEMLRTIDSAGSAIGQALLAAATVIGGEAMSFGRALIDLVAKAIDPSVPDAQVAGKAQEVFTSYQQFKPSLPAVATSVLDPVIVGVATKIPSELALGPSATGPATMIPATMIPGQQPSGGIPWIWIGAGAVVLIGGYMLLGGSKREVKANRRRRRR